MNFSYSLMARWPREIHKYKVTEVDTMGGSCQVAIPSELKHFFFEKGLGDLESQQFISPRKSLKLIDA